MSDAVGYRQASGAPTLNVPATSTRRMPVPRAALSAGVLLMLLGGAAAFGQDSDKPAAATQGAPGAAGKTAAPDTRSPAEKKSQASYSIGVSMGAQLHSMGITPDSLAIDRVTQGLKDSLGGKVTPSSQDQQNIQGFIRGAHDAMGEKNHATAAAFLAENGKKQGVVTTASGLQYRVLKPGEGTPPKPTDEVTVNYRGTLLDGTEFDSSYKRGQPASFPVNGVIPGWQEALVLMKPGSKYELFIPPKLAYDLQSPPAIPPGSLLKFEVELLSVKAPKPAAATPAPAPKPSGQ
jgi:FKBP-type peptidyl-prolyl cis-trans isomerase